MDRDLNDGQQGSRPDRREQRSPWQYWRISVLVLVGLSTLVVLYLTSMLGRLVDEIHEPLPTEVADEWLPSPARVGEPVNVLVMGLDDERLRTDTMILASMDMEAKKVTLLQIPRDTRTLVAGPGKMDKVNAAYAYGVGDKRFPANLRALRTVQELVGVKVHYTVAVDLEGFRRAIDEIGGVWVDLTWVMDYDDPTQNLHIHLQPGRQKLNGKKALEFVRWRHNNDGTGYPDGDLGRIRTQQQFMSALMDQLFKATNLPFLPSQAMTVARYVESTIEPTRLAALAKLAASVRKQDVTILTLPGVDASLYEPEEGLYISYFLPDPEAIQQIVDREIYGIKPAIAGQIHVQLADQPTDPRVEFVRQRLISQGFAVSLGPALEQIASKTRVIALDKDEAKSQLVARALMAQGLEIEMLVKSAASIGGGIAHAASGVGPVLQGGPEIPPTVQVILGQLKNP